MIELFFSQGKKGRPFPFEKNLAAMKPEKLFRPVHLKRHCGSCRPPAETISAAGIKERDENLVFRCPYSCELMKRERVEKCRRRKDAEEIDSREHEQTAVFGEKKIPTGGETAEEIADSKDGERRRGFFGLAGTMGAAVSNNRVASVVADNDLFRIFNRGCGAECCPRDRSGSQLFLGTRREE
jgi:hypothetical protein